MAWQSSTINPATTTPAADISKITNDLSVLRGVIGGTADAAVPSAWSGKTSDTGAAKLPNGTTAQRDVSPAVGYFRFNTTLGQWEYYTGSAWVQVMPDDGTAAKLTLAQTFTKAQRGAVVALTDGATITPDFSLANNFSVTLGGSRTLANPTNLTAGQSGVITITQDATGSRALAFGSQWKFPGGTTPTLTTTANAVDDLVYFVESSTRIAARLIGAVA